MSDYGRESVPIKTWETLRRQQVLDASPWIRVWREEIRLPNGHIVDDYYTIETHEFVVVVPITSQGEALILRQYRHGAHEIVLNFPAGFIKYGESSLQAAQRELLEETGYGGGAWNFMGEYTIDGNRGCGKAHYFLAQEIIPLNDPSSGDLEDQEIIHCSANDLHEIFFKNKIKTIASAFAYLLASSLPEGDTFFQNRSKDTI